MSSGRSSGAGIVLGLTILGFIIFLFIFWPVAFAILFIGLAVFCALQSSHRTQRTQPQERKPSIYQPQTPPQIPEWETTQRPNYYPAPRREPSPQSGVKIPIEESEEEAETGRVYRMPTEEEAEVSTSIPERVSREEPRVTTAKKGTELGNLEEELEATRSKYEKMGTTTVETTEKIEKKEAPTAKQITIPDEKAERIKDLESEEEATQALMEELKDRWMSGKIDLDMYERLKEKYEKKIEDIEKQKKET
jgi:uncharacterized membrane protein